MVSSGGKSLVHIIIIFLRQSFCELQSDIQFNKCLITTNHVQGMMPPGKWQTRTALPFIF